MKKRTTKNTGWATLELVMSLPIIILLIAVIFYAGKLGFTRLHLANAVDAGARIAAVKGCSEAENYVKKAFSHSHLVTPRCRTGKTMELTATYKVQFPLASLTHFNQEITVKAYALNEVDTF